MKIHFATDHAGYELKSELLAYVRDLSTTLDAGEQYEVIDSGAYEYDAADDYPDFVHKAAGAVAANSADTKAIIIGGSGQGEAMVANRYTSVRAAVYNAPNLEIIRLSREHNDANVLSLGARFLTIDEAKEAVKLWLGTDFTKDERHVRRIGKMDRVKRG